MKHDETGSSIESNERIVVAALNFDLPSIRSRSSRQLFLGTYFPHCYDLYLQ